MIVLLLHIIMWTYITFDNIQTYMNTVKDNRLLCIPYQKHNVLYFWYLYNMDTQDEAIVSISHPDLPTVNDTAVEFIIKQNPHNIVYDYIISNSFSANLIYWLHTQQSLKSVVDPDIAYLYKTTYKDLPYHSYMPISVLTESCQELKDGIIASYKFEQPPQVYEYYDSIQSIFKRLDSSGVCVNKKIAKKRFGIDVIDDIIYPSTHFYSLTGRPTTVLQKVSVGSLHKTGVDRKLIQSRFGSDGYIMEMDFDAYHIRLTAYQIGYDFPDDESVHMHFAKQYFNTDKITDALYEESKKITFKHLYSANYTTLPIQYPFFEKLHTHLRNIERLYDTNGFIESPYTERRMYHIENATAGKLLSYINQCCETEVNAQLIDKIMDSLNGLDSKMILYMYDAFIFDIRRDELNSVLELVHPITASVAPVKIKLGSSFKDMTVINWGEC